MASREIAWPGDVSLRRKWSDDGRWRREGNMTVFGAGGAWAARNSARNLWRQPRIEWGPVTTVDTSKKVFRKKPNELSTSISSFWGVGKTCSWPGAKEIE